MLLLGFSDHSIGPEMALASVALGACILERHYTDSRYRKGPDIACSMDPAELRHLVDRSQEIHIALHNEKKRTALKRMSTALPGPAIVADKNLPQGHRFTEQDFWARRPGNGEIPGFRFDQVLGKRLTRELRRNDQLKWSDLTN